MNEELQDLFRAKGLSEEHLELIMATDPTLCSVADLVSGAVSETDARSWANEIGLDGHFVKSYFIQSWLHAWNVFHRMPEAGGTLSPGGKLLSRFKPRSGLGDDGLKDKEVLNEKSILVNSEAFMASCASHNSSHLAAFVGPGCNFLRRVPAQGMLSGSTSPTQSSMSQMPLLSMESETELPSEAEMDLPSEPWQDSPGRQSIEKEMELPHTVQDPLGMLSSEEAASLNTTTEDTMTTDECAQTRKALQELMARGIPKGNSSSLCLETPLRRAPPEFLMRPRSASLVEENTRVEQQEPTVRERMGVAFPVGGTTSSPVQLQLTERVALEEASALMRREDAAACKTPGPPRSQMEEMVPVPSKQCPQDVEVKSQDFDTSSDSKDSEASERPDNEFRRQIMPGGVEECATEGGLSTPLLGILKQSRLTSFEIKLLGEKIGSRTITEVASSWRNEGEVMRAGKDAGVTSSVSLGYLVQAWHKCIATVAAARQPLLKFNRSGHGHTILSEPCEYPLSAMCVRGDYATACNLLMQRLGKKKTDLVPLLKGLLCHISGVAYHRTPDDRKVQAISRKVLPIVASAYGRDVAIQVGRKAEVEEAEARWTWMIKALSKTRMRIALQKES